MSANGDFSRDPLGFLASNLVLMPVTFNGDLQDGIKKFNLLHQPTVIAKRLGTMIPVYFLFPSATDTGIRAYWLPYRGDKVFGTTVGKFAKFMFTATMDGCSLGVGHDVGDGTRFVSHANAGGLGAKLEPQLGMDKAREEQRRMQQSLITRKHGGSGNVEQTVTPLNYMTDVDGALVLKSTTIGIRPNGVDDWHIYAHRYYKDMGKQLLTYFLRDTVRVF